jgi:hypothetical protein
MDDLERAQYMDWYADKYTEHRVSHGPLRPMPEDKPAQPQPEDKPAVEKFDDER